MAVKPQLGSALQECFRNQQDLSAFSDFTVVVESVPFQCHKVILNACSEFFQALFRSQMKECLENSVELQGVTVKAFSVIFDAMYKGIDGLTERNIIEVWHATVLLQIGFMIDECENFVNEKMTTGNCFDFYINAIQFDSKKVKEFACGFVTKNFELCKKQYNFNKLPLIEVYNILQDDNLKADSEDSVVDIIVNWINYAQVHGTPLMQSQINIDSGSKDDIVVSKNVEDRRQDVLKLLSTVRLCLVSHECLRKLFDHDVIMSCRAARDLIFSAINYKLSVKLRHDAWPDAAVHRATSDMKEAMIFASGKTVNVYLLKDGSTQEYTTIPDKQMVSLVVFDNVLYLTERDSLKMCSQTKVWETLLAGNIYASTPTRRSILLSVGNYIYSYGGGNKSLQRFNCAHGCDKKWEVQGRDIDNVESMIRYKDNILLFCKPNYTVPAPTHLFCSDSNKVYEVSPNKPFSGPLDGIVSFTYNDNVFVLQKNGILWKVVSGQVLKIWCLEFLCELWGFLWQIYGCVIYQKQLLIFGSGNKPAGFLWPTSIPGIIDKVKVIQIQSDTPCLSIVVAVKK